MSSVFIPFTSGIADYLLYASTIAALLVTIAWWITKLGRVRAPVYHHLIWLCTMFAILAAPLIWLFGPKATIAILPARHQSEFTSTERSIVQPTATALKNNPQADIESFSEDMMPLTDSYLEPLAQVSIKPILVCLWAFGFLIMLLRILTA